MKFVAELGEYEPQVLLAREDIAQFESAHAVVGYRVKGSDIPEERLPDGSALLSLKDAFGIHEVLAERDALDKRQLSAFRRGVEKITVYAGNEKSIGRLTTAIAVYQDRRENASELMQQLRVAMTLSDQPELYMVDDLQGQKWTTLVQTIIEAQETAA